MFIGNTYLEYIPAKVGNIKKRAVVMLPGLPYSIKRYEIESLLSENGFDVFYLNYEGTQKSNGTFLERSPVDNVNDVVEALNKGLDIGGRLYQTYDTSILATSFGGGVALSVPDKPYITSVVALSPVISFKTVKLIETLGPYLEKEYPGQFRFEQEQWQLMLEDKLYSPIENKDLNSDKIFIIAGAQDEQISVDEIKNFAEGKNIEIDIQDEAGHISFSKINEDMMNKIIRFIEGKSKNI